MSIFNECYDSFFKENFIGNLIEKNIDFSKKEFEKNDLSKLLNSYKEKMKTILKKDIKLTEALQTIKSIILKINEEAENAQRFIINIGNTDRDVEKLKKEVISYLNRIYLKSKKDLDYTSMERNIKDLIITVRMDLKFTYEESIILWIVKNGFSKYLKNDF